MAGVATLELRLRDGDTVAVPLDAEGFFRQTLAIRNPPTALIARDAAGEAIYNVAIPPRHATSQHPGSDR